MKNSEIKNNIEDELIHSSLGISGKDEEEVLKAKLKKSSKDSNELQKEYNNLASLIAVSLMFSRGEKTPSPGVKEKLFEKINLGKNSNSGNDNGSFDFKFADSDDWMQHPEIEGIKVKRLAYNEKKGYLMILMKAAAGAEYPPHHHSGAEECYVLEGDLYVQGKYLGPGDFHHAEGDSDHDPLRTKNGCTLLLVVDPRDY